MLRVARLDMAERLHASHFDFTDRGRSHLRSFTRLFVHVFERYAGEVSVAQDLADHLGL